MADPSNTGSALSHMRLYPLPSLYDQSVAIVKAGTPVDTSSFYLKKSITVPWSVLPTTFIFETSRPELPHTFTVNDAESFTVVPGSETVSLQFVLTKGTNRIDVTSPSYVMRGAWGAATPYSRFDTVSFGGGLWLAIGSSLGSSPVEGPNWTQDAETLGSYEADSYLVAATAVETWFRSLGREYYLTTGRRLQEIDEQFLSPWATRFSAHLLPFTDLFLPSQMPKLHQTRMTIIASMGQRLGYGDGVLRVASALSYSTPWVTQSKLSEFSVPGLQYDYPGVTSHPTTGEDHGRLLDLWYPNLCLASKLALIQLTQTLGSTDTPKPKPLSLVDFDDYQILLRSSGGDIEVHRADPLSPDCAAIEYNTSCDSEVRTYAVLDQRVDAMMNTPQMPFDEVVENPLNFGFWDEGSTLDMSDGSGSPGLGGGDETFDTVDPDDPFGTGFLGVSLSGRLDGPACLDSRVQRGERLVKHVVPITGTATPEPSEMTTGTRLVVDTVSVGAPNALIGTARVWATTKKLFLFQGDYVRVENPDADMRVLTCWPRFDVNSIISKSGAGVASTSAGQIVVTFAAPFFEFRHQGMGVQVTSGITIEYASISSISSDGLTATLAGNSAIPLGAVTVDVYFPHRDRLVTRGAPFAGDRVMDITFTTNLAKNLADQESLDQRDGVLVVGDFLAGVTTIDVASDISPIPGDKLYLTSGSFIEIDSAFDTGLKHHTTKLTIWQMNLMTATAGALSNDQPLYSISTNPCWEYGDPITNLTLISITPTVYLS